MGPDLTSELALELRSPVTCRHGEGFASASVDGAVVRGQVLPYGKWVRLTPTLLERFEPGTFARSTRDPARVKVCLAHGQVVGRVTSLVETDTGLSFEGQLSASVDIPEARKAQAMIAEGLADELSVGFQGLPGGTDVEVRQDGTTLWRHRKLRLKEISLVPWGAMGRDATLTRAQLAPDFDEHAAELAAQAEQRRHAARVWLAAYRGTGV